MRTFQHGFMRHSRRRLGGLGIRSAVQLAPSAFLASASASSALVHHIIPPALQGSPISNRKDAMDHWSEGHSEAPPDGLAQHRQKNWETIKTTESANLLLEAAPDPRTWTCLLSSRVRDRYLAECSAYLLPRPTYG